MTTLTNAPLVMIWRRVEDLSTAQRNADLVNGWPAVGGDGYSAMYDGGNVLIAYWNQAEFLRTESTSEPTALSSSCSDQNFALRATAYNPSNQLTLAAGDIARVTESLGSLAGRPLRPREARDRLGRAISFVDNVGNTTRYVRLSRAALADGVGRRLKSLDEAGLSSDAFHPVIGYELLVSDLGAARSFYADVLDLRESAGSAPDNAVFDVGNVFLSLKTEPSAGLVSNVERAGKLGDDLVVFHVDNVEAAADELSRRGVLLPHGIEDSEHGRLAVFKDPDGHVLSAWEAPPRSPAPRINYFPVLDRLLASAAALGDR